MNLPPNGSRAVPHFAANCLGRDFAVGDIHGCFGLLEAELARVGFDPGRGDRLFAVGDLVDRGPESHRVLSFLSRPWFHSVRGNHEQMAIQFACGDLAERAYSHNGGDWLIRLEPVLRTRFVVAFQTLPIAMTVQVGDRRIGVVHADCPFATWADFESALRDNNVLRQYTEFSAMWERSRYVSHGIDSVADIDAVIVGHTSVDRPMQLGNVHFIDTGACFQGGRLTVMNLTETFGEWR
ncbi:metallophosphoesterase [Burkholderia pyrrocinia]|uniref:metallophosphoesterase n=1 Tax=Burkholderia pyrrocinia TaxID=60550 RepID=UPI001BCB0C29|nr:metallophosphoesterase [Burkholderia pyrrocinia]QVN18952.1 metallophosphoesterase [Burkholderia pyrrocinia]